jgi:ABC-type glycerol-3-phosphate transport system substrate-binding protein
MLPDNFNYFIWRIRMKKTTVAILSVLLIISLTLPLFAAGESQSQSSGSKDIEIFQNPWLGTPLDEPDPYKEWLDQFTGMNWKLTGSTDFESQLASRAAAGSMPDIIVFDLSRMLFSMYDQGVLLDDWNPYKSAMPKTFKNMGETAVKYFTKKGKLTAIPTLPGDQLYCFNIRQDWLDNLGLKTPTTPDELFAAAKAFTFNDPDGNGKNDTYGFTSAGNRGIGEIANLGLMWGPTTFYVENNKVTHPIIDGNYKKMLDFLKKAVDEQIIDPDWYTIGWSARSPNLYNGKYGIAWYPPEALLSETDQIRQDHLVLNWYSVLEMPKGSPKGGRLNPQTPFGIIRTVSANAAKDKAKMDAIIKVLESTALPGMDYWRLREGYEIDNYDAVPVGSRYYWNLTEISKPHRCGTNEGQNWGFRNYGKFICSYSFEGNPLEGAGPQPTEVTLMGVKMSEQVLAHPTYANDYYLLNLNNDNSVSAQAVSDEFSIQYILGQTTDYDGFVKRWLTSGGQKLIDEAAQQLKDFGIIK